MSRGGVPALKKGVSASKEGVIKRGVPIVVPIICTKGAQKISGLLLQLQMGPQMPKKKRKNNTSPTIRTLQQRRKAKNNMNGGGIARISN